jgi:hypothetical protein
MLVRRPLLAFAVGACPAVSVGALYTDLVTSLPSDVSKLNLRPTRHIHLGNPEPFRGHTPTAQRWMIYSVLRMYSTHSSSLEW